MNFLLLLPPNPLSSVYLSLLFVNRPLVTRPQEQTRKSTTNTLMHF